MSIPNWWRDATAYQIYPRSFMDTNGDGIGDLAGVLAKLDYLQDLGITALWFSPFYPSPNFDVGYDIADYTDVSAEYGTLADFDRLLAAAHQRGMRVILDLVLNHTSIEHGWFQESRKSRHNSYRDWYVWRDPAPDGGPPNDWEAGFGGSAWTFDPQTEQYYYHYFFPEQPDLNWRNPRVKAAMFDAVRFWLDRGIDGFRLDAIGTLFEDVNLTPSGVPDSVLDFWRERLKTGGFWPVTLDEKMRFQHDQPENFALIAELRALIDEYPERLMLGETDDPRYYGNGQDGLHSLFNFSLMNISNPSAAAIRQVIQARLPKVPQGAWDCNTLGNHDSRRVHSRLLEYAKDERAYLALMGLVMMLPGTPMLYYGDEIGMGEHFLHDVADFKDNLGVWSYNELRAGGTSEAEALKLAQQLVSRDKCRTPMQWDASPNAGFAAEGVATWLPVNPNYAEGVNVAAQMGVGGSNLEHFRTLARLRAEYAALRQGRFQLLNATGEILAFWRRTAQGAALVAINFSGEERRASLGMSRLRRAYSNYGTFYTAAELGRRPASEDLAGLKFKPYEVLVCIA